MGNSAKRRGLPCAHTVQCDLAAGKRMMRTCQIAWLLVVCWLVICPAKQLAAQEAESAQSQAYELPELETDRDSFTPATTVVGADLTMIEGSYSFIDNRRVAETHSFPELLFRRGISERLELRLGWNYEVGGTGGIVSGSEDAGEFGGGFERESQMLYGLKYLLTEQRDWLPRSSAIVEGYTPTSGEATATDIVVTYVFGWDFAERYKLDSAMRYGTDNSSQDTFNQWAPSLVLRARWTEQWHSHIEYFGIYSNGAENDLSRAFISPGIHYLPHPNLELGVRVGWGISTDAPNFFGNVGVGYRY